VNSPAERIAESLKAFGFDRVSRVPLDSQAAEFLSEARANEQIELLRQYVADLGRRKVLEVGSGFGAFVAICNSKGVCQAYGIEPGEDAYGSAYEISLDVLSGYGVSADRIRKGFGESIPFPAESFGAVFSSNVLEHTADPERVLEEVVRILQVGGRAVLVFPNYGSWWEGHYGLIFPPYCPKWLFKGFVRLLGRDPGFVDTLQFVTYRKLRRWLARFGDHIRVLTYGQELWEYRLRTLTFSEWAALDHVKRIVRVIHRMRMVDSVVWLGKKLHWETPFVLVIEKLAPTLAEASLSKSPADGRN